MQELIREWASLLPVSMSGLTKARTGMIEPHRTQGPGCRRMDTARCKRVLATSSVDDWAVTRTVTPRTCLCHEGSSDSDASTPPHCLEFPCQRGPTQQTIPQRCPCCYEPGCRHGYKHSDAATAEGLDWLLHSHVQIGSLGGEEMLKLAIWSRSARPWRVAASAGFAGHCNCVLGSVRAEEIRVENMLCTDLFCAQLSSWTLEHAETGNVACCTIYGAPHDWCTASVVHRTRCRTTLARVAPSGT